MRKQASKQASFTAYKPLRQPDNAVACELPD
jgi:hypothetical protein